MEPGFRGDRDQLLRMERVCARVSDLLLRARRLEWEGYTEKAEAVRKQAVDLLVEMERLELTPPHPREPASRKA